MAVIEAESTERFVMELFTSLVEQLFGFNYFFEMCNLNLITYFLKKKNKNSVLKRNSAALS